MRTVYEAANLIDAHLVRQALEAAGIPAFVRGEALRRKPARRFPIGHSPEAGAPLRSISTPSAKLAKPGETPTGSTRRSTCSPMKPVVASPITNAGSRSKRARKAALVRTGQTCT